jgi:hypothetical protein
MGSEREVPSPLTLHCGIAYVFWPATATQKLRRQARMLSAF